MNKGDLYVEKETGIVYVVKAKQTGGKFHSYLMERRFGFAAPPPTTIPDDKKWVIMERHNTVKQAPLRYIRLDTFANEFESLEAWTSRRLLEQESGNGEK
jgi:hypothetical protein